MTLRVIGAVMALTTMTASAAHADTDIPDSVLTAADQAGVSPMDLAGAVSTTGLEPHDYLCMADHVLCPPPPVQSSSSPLVECIIRHESRGDPRAVNRSSGASGLGQFLPGTWRTTPQGKAGMSVFDPAANRAAVAYMIAAGRGREFATIGLCR